MSERRIHRGVKIHRQLREFAEEDYRFYSRISNFYSVSKHMAVEGVDDLTDFEAAALMADDEHRFDAIEDIAAKLDTSAHLRYWFDASRITSVNGTYYSYHIGTSLEQPIIDLPEAVQAELKPKQLRKIRKDHFRNLAMTASTSYSLSTARPDAIHPNTAYTFSRRDKPLHTIDTTVFTGTGCDGIYTQVPNVESDDGKNLLFVPSPIGIDALPFPQQVEDVLVLRAMLQTDAMRNFPSVSDFDDTARNVELLMAAMRGEIMAEL